MESDEIWAGPAQMCPKIRPKPAICEPVIVLIGHSDREMVLARGAERATLKIEVCPKAIDMTMPKFYTSVTFNSLSFLFTPLAVKARYAASEKGVSNFWTSNSWLGLKFWIKSASGPWIKMSVQLTTHSLRMRWFAAPCVGELCRPLELPGWDNLPTSTHVCSVTSLEQLLLIPLLMLQHLVSNLIQSWHIKALQIDSPLRTELKHFERKVLKLTPLARTTWSKLVRLKKIECHFLPTAHTTSVAFGFHSISGPRVESCMYIHTSIPS